MFYFNLTYSDLRYSYVCADTEIIFESCLLLSGRIFKLFSLKSLSDLFGTFVLCLPLSLQCLFELHWLRQLTE